MKFKDIKVGDTVYYFDKVVTSTGVTAGFCKPAKVVKVTPKRFTISLGEDKWGRLQTEVYAKKDGKIVKSWYTSGMLHVWKLGETANDRDFHTPRLVKDESDEVQAFIDQWESSKGKLVLELKEYARALAEKRIAEVWQFPEPQLYQLVGIMKQIVGPLEESDE